MKLEHHLTSGSDADDFLQRVVASALRDARPDVSESLLDILAELLDNAMTHGDSPAGTEFSLRTGGGGVVAIVTDHGMGIRAHLTRAGIAIESDAQAIEVAVREGTTGAYEPRGYGLPDNIAALDHLSPARLRSAPERGSAHFTPTIGRSSPTSTLQSPERW